MRTRILGLSRDRVTGYLVGGAAATAGCTGGAAAVAAAGARRLRATR